MNIICNNEKVNVMWLISTEKCTYEDCLYTKGTLVNDRIETYLVLKNGSEVKCISYFYKENENTIFYINEFVEKVENYYETCITRTNYKLNNISSLYDEIKKIMG